MSASTNLPSTTDTARTDDVTPLAVTRERTENLEFQQLMAQNPIGALLSLLMLLFGMFDEDTLMDGNLLNFIGDKFGVDNPAGLIRGLGTPAGIGEIDVGTRQQMVIENLNGAAAAAGISPDLLAGVWGIETRFGTHETLISASGCAGDFQFTRRTFASMIDKHGDEIARQLDGQISGDVAAALRSGNWDIATEWGTDLRFHPAVSAHASAFYLGEVAAHLGVDPMQEENFGAVFAGYNVGPGNADKLLAMHNAGSGQSAAAKIGDPAGWNPKFFENNATGTEALSRYQSHVMTRAADFQRLFGAPETRAEIDIEAEADEPAVKEPFDTATGPEPATAPQPDSLSQPTDPIVTADAGTSAATPQTQTSTLSTTI